MGIHDPAWGSDSANGIFIAFAAVAIWSSVPLTFRLFLTFKKRTGLYFYAILVTTWGLSIREIGYMITILAGNPAWPFGDVLAQAGWIAMVTGFATVLYSRLNLITDNLKLRRAVLAMIIINAMIWHPFMITLSFGRITLQNAKKFEERAKWNKVYQPLERIHICFFNGQEILISSLYIRAAYQYLRSRFAKEEKIRKAMIVLLAVQAIVVCIDLTIIIIDFLGLLTVKLFIHSFIYCVKLELEFVVLNQLVELSQMGAVGVMSFSLRTQEGRAGQLEMNAGKAPSFVTSPKLDPWDVPVHYPEDKSPRVDSFMTVTTPSAKSPLQNDFTWQQSYGKDDIRQSQREIPLSSTAT